MTRRTVDIEDALQSALSSDGYSASAPPIPGNLGATLPHVHVVRTGGYEASIVQDMHQVDLDVYASEDWQAAGTASELTAWVRSLPGSLLGGVPCYTASISTLPYPNPDPDRGDVSRYTLSAQILTRMADE